MTEPEAALIPNVSSTSDATGKASRMRSRGVRRPTVVQNSRMPILVVANTAANPETRIPAARPHLAPLPSAKPSAVDSNANFATNPGKGGRPATSMTQQTNMNPRNAMAAGSAVPTSSSTPYGSISATPNAV